MTPYYDSHIHLDQYPKEHTDQLIQDWREKGVQGVLAVSTNLPSSYQTLELKQKYPDFVFAAVGYHPEQALPSKQEFDELCALLLKERDNISAIGEVGLPHYAYQSGGLLPPVEAYAEWLVEFAKLSVFHQLPLVLHAVHDKAEIALSIVKKHSVKQAQFHWLKAPLAIVEDIVHSGYFISVTPEVCYRTRDQLLTKHIPMSQLLLETDGPWRYDETFRHRPTSPLFIPEVAEQAASLKGCTSDALLSMCNENLKRLLSTAL